MKILKVFALAVILLPTTTAMAKTDEIFANWTLTVVEDSSNNAAVVSLRQDSLKTIKDEYAKQDLNPQIQFRCTPDDPEIMAQINWQRFISSFSIELGFKVDGGKITWLKWQVDQSNKVTISPSAMDSQKLVDLALGGTTLLVEVTPYSASPVTVEYELAEFSGALAKMNARCSR